MNLKTLCPFFSFSDDRLTKVSNVKVYIDLKNIFRALYVEDILKEIIEYTYSDSGRFISSVIFQSILLYVSLWKEFLSSFRNISNYSIYVFTDTGESIYHSNILPTYKCSRHIDTKIFSEKIEQLKGSDLPTEIKETEIEKLKKRVECVSKNTEFLELQRKFKPIRDNNFELSTKFLNKIKNVHFFMLKNLETDFLPYFLITRRFNEEKDVLHIVCSNDHDMYQNLILSNVIQIFSLSNKFCILDNSNVIPYFLYKTYGVLDPKKKQLIEKLSLNDIPIIMSLCGDPGDDVVKPIKKVGVITAAKMLSERDISYELIGTLDELNARVYETNSFFKSKDIHNIHSSNWSKLFSVVSIDELDVLLVKVYKLISYEQISRWLDEKDSMFKLNTLKSIDLTLQKNIEVQYSNVQILNELLSKNLPDFSLHIDNLKMLVE